MNYVGIDYHKKYSVATVISQDGVVLVQNSATGNTRATL
jgi:hypothetical protein